jgi:hypothetical protein
MDPHDEATSYPTHQAETPTFTTITLKTASGWTEQAAACSLCSAVVLDREIHRQWHAQFVHVR